MFYVLFLIIIQFSNCFELKENWILSNFGSSFGSESVLFDINNDGINDLIAISVDGELNVISVKTGLSIDNEKWPMYLPNDHFMSKPIIYYTYNDVKIVVISVQGSIYIIDSNGIVVNILKIPVIFLSNKWESSHTEISSLISLENQKQPNDNEIILSSNVYANSYLIDLSATGRMVDIVIPVNYLPRENDTKSNVILTAIATFNLNSSNLISISPINLSRKESDNSNYWLNDFDLLYKENRYMIIATFSSGVIHYLFWDRFYEIFRIKKNKNDGSIVYNPGPHKCFITHFCSQKSGANREYLQNQLCCIYSDYSNHLALFTIPNSTILWEYNFMDGDTTTPLHFVYSSMTKSSEHAENDKKNGPYIIFGTNKGYVHCVSMLTAESCDSFPLKIENSTFSVSPQAILDVSKAVSILLLSDEGNFYNIPLFSPNDWTILLTNEQLDSYLAPMYVKSHYTTNVLFHTKNGYIWSYQINGFIQESDVYLDSYMKHDDTVIPTLYGHGTLFTIGFDIKSQYADNGWPVTDNYTIKLYYNHRQILSLNHRVTSSSYILIDLSKHEEVFSNSIILSGLISYSISLSKTGQIIASPNPYFPIPLCQLRMNIEFQQEIIWLVWITAAISFFSIFFAHFYCQLTISSIVKIPLFHSESTDNKS